MVLGATGMLGSAIFRRAEERALHVLGTTTDLRHVPPWFKTQPLLYRTGVDKLEPILRQLGDGDYVINCVGLIKHHLDESSLSDREAAIMLNASLPHELNRIADEQGFRVLQIATDCVFSGMAGGYGEHDAHDAHDVYGKTKSLGEVPGENFMHLRSSIIGRELRNHRSLLDWALLQPEHSRVQGYVNHLWNGVSTTAFARIALGVIAQDDWVSGVVHLIPRDVVSKHDLLEMTLTAFNREDITLSAVRAAESIDRSLRTIDPSMNQRMWRAGGYDGPPSIREMVEEIADEERLN